MIIFQTQLFQHILYENVSISWRHLIPELINNSNAWKLFFRLQIKPVSCYSLSRTCTRSKETLPPTASRPNSTWTPLRQTWTTRCPASTPHSTRPPPTSWPSWDSPPDSASSADSHVTFRALETNFFLHTWDIYVICLYNVILLRIFLSKYTF